MVNGLGDRLDSAHRLAADGWTDEELANCLLDLLIVQPIDFADAVVRAYPSDLSRLCRFCQLLALRLAEVAPSVCSTGRLAERRLAPAVSHLRGDGLPHAGEAPAPVNPWVAAVPAWMCRDRLETGHAP